MTVTRALLALTLLGLTVAPQVAAAQSYVAEGFVADYRNGDSPVGIGFEYHWAPFARLGTASLGFAAGFQGDTDGNAWAGGGVSALQPLGRNWLAEASVMAGLYHAGSAGTDLGDDLEFRSLLGLGYRINDSTTVSLAIQHMSNLGLGSRNPGVNAIGLRLRRSF